MLDKMEWQVKKDLNSDHNPIIITFREEDSVPGETREEKPRYKWRTKEVDWEKFRSKVEELIPTRFQRKSVYKLEKLLREAIITAAKKYIGKKKISKKKKIYLTSEIREEIKKRNRLRRDMTNNREEWINSCKKIAEMIQQERRENWKTYVSKLNMKTDEREVWRTIRSIEGGQEGKGKNEIIVVAVCVYA